MTATTRPAAPGAGPIRTRPSIYWTFADARAVTGRNLLQYVRIPQLLVFSTIQPVMFVLLFVFVFGGAIAASVPGGNYVNFLMPGIFVQTVVFGATATGVGLAEDLGRGMIDRFRSLPMARSAVLAGRTFADLIRNMLVVLLMTAVGVLVGFEPLTGGLPAFILMLAIVVAFGYAFSWVSALIGLRVKDPESVQAAGFIWIFPLTFCSSAFVPIDTMPTWLQPIATINPITVAVNACRTLLSGTATIDTLWPPIAWTILILAVFVPLSVRAYRRVS
jgi:ABC-2 type transport system permease protein/oleandomycin transport system permease protein